MLDDLSRAGAERNLSWLRAGHGDRLRVEIADVREARAVRRAVRGASAVFHLAAQVAVTSSLREPAHDFTVNAGGTLTLLEALRAMPQPPPLVFTSTNKVYGSLADVALRETAMRWEAADRPAGIDESRPIDFHTPYGCSKGAADQYVLDYSRSFGLETIVFRMSCIYGPRQLGTEDQGWIAHLTKRALARTPIEIFGDGKQVRDVLYVGDLVDAFLLAWKNADRLRGRAFNIGGGPANTVSLLELLGVLQDHLGLATQAKFRPWRTGDQKWYVSDTRAFAAETGWAPTVPLGEGLAHLAAWLEEDRRSRSRRVPLPASADRQPAG